MKKIKQAKSSVIKFPGNFAGQKLEEAAERRPSKSLKKSVKKFKPGSK